MLAMLIGAMMFGYMVSTVGSIVATFERDASERQAKMDSVKDWMASRNVPQKLFVRVRTYYEHYYGKKSAFNEEEILSSLPPGLRNECTSVLLRDTLGVFPLFALVGIDFQRAVYPHLKPVMYVHQDLIYKRGDKAEDTYFLRKGAVDVLAGGSGTLVLFRVNQGQHFGEEAFTNQKRASNIISNGMTEAWTLSNDKLEDVVRQLGRAVRSKLEDFITLELARKQRLNSLSYRALIAEAKSADRRAALIMQKAFVSFANKKAREASSIFAELQADVKEPSVGRGATGASSGALHSVLFEIRQQMKAMKTTLKSQSDLLERTARVPNEAPDMLSPRSDSTARTSASARRSKCVSMNSFVCRPACNQAPSTISAA
jgi:CRP-like cAMP-binding protein